MTQLKRRKQNRTSYSKRLKLLKSEKTRILVRKSSKNMIIQFINYHENGDKVLLTITTKSLEKMGYKGSRSNIPSAYLLGLLAGKKAQEKKIKEGILDIGLYEPVAKSRLFAALKGLVDSGLDIPHDPEVFPSEERIKGKHISNYLKEASEPQFSRYRKEKITSDALEKNIQETKDKIMKGK
jgi:large subunit ribosomal protein L18